MNTPTGQLRRLVAVLVVNPLELSGAQVHAPRAGAATAKLSVLLLNCTNCLADGERANRERTIG